MRAWTIALIMGSVGFILAACGGGSDDTTAAPNGGEPGQTTSTATGPGISIGEAKVSELDGPLLVNGFLLITDGRPELCDSFTTTSPPTCEGDHFVVEGLDVSLLEGLQVVASVQWSAERMQLLGSVEGDTLVVSSLHQG